MATILSVMQKWYEQSTLAQPEIISIYNTQSPLPRYYKMTLSSPECTAAITAAAIKADCLDTIYPECGANEMFTHMTEVPAEEATRDDLVFFDWNKNGTMDHVGAVLLVDGDRVISYEANVGGHRMYRREFSLSAYRKEYGQNSVRFVRPFKRKVEGTPNNTPIDTPVVDAPSAWAKEAMDWAVETGLIQGDSHGLRPHDPVTREELAVILYRLMHKE